MSTMFMSKRQKVLQFLFLLREPLLLVLLMVLFLLSGLAFDTSGGALGVRPTVIDDKAKARDILRESVTLINQTGRVVEVYPFVRNIETVSGEQVFLDPSRADHSSSLANWIELSRAALLLKPGEERRVDFTIDVNLRAKAGAYHALISFAEGSKRSEAEVNLPSAPSVTINVEVLEDIRERLELVRFVPDHTFAAGFPVSFSYAVRNTGNRPLAPTGEIRIYNRRGEEISSIPVSADGQIFELNSNHELAANWPGPGGGRDSLVAGVFKGLTGFGRYKAILDLEYGAGGRGRLQDTVFFWVIPWREILTIFGILSVAVIMLTITLHRRYRQTDDDYGEPNEFDRRGSFDTRGGFNEPGERKLRMIDLRATQMGASINTNLYK